MVIQFLIPYLLLFIPCFQLNIYFLFFTHTISISNSGAGLQGGACY